MHSDTIRILTDLPTPRVWSMLVTIFGDLAQDPKDRIDGTLLRDLTDGMGIKPEAVRVALHRLRNDDWITSVKSGRRASHALTAYGRKESQSVSALIYSPPQDMPRAWQIALTPTNDSQTREKMQRAGFVQLAPRSFIASALATAPNTATSLPGGTAPEWLRHEVVPSDLTAQYSKLMTPLRRLSVALDQNRSLAPSEIALLRCLIVHHWRRLVLRHPYLPADLTGPDWPGHTCRAEVAALLTRLPRPSLMDLQAT